MAPKLYGVFSSPPVRAVLMCAKASGVELEFVPVDLLQKAHLKEDFLKKNPQHTVPLLEESDGFTVADSHAIMAYLVSQYGKDDSLHPKNDNRLRATIDHALFFDASILFVAGFNISKPLLFSGIKPSEEKLNDMKHALEVLDSMLGQRKSKYIAGDSLSIADFSIVATVTTTDVYVPYSAYPNIKTYIERFQKLSCYSENRIGLAQYNELAGSKLNA